MTDQDRWERYLYERQSPAELARWARSLRYFRFCRAYGGHANDGDVLLVALRAASEPELLDVFGRLGLPVVRLPADEPRPVPGVAYTAAAFQAFRHAVYDHPTIQEPGHVRLAGTTAWAWVSGGRLELHVSDEANPYDVTDAAVERARRIEPLLAPLADRIVDPPRNNRNCVCPRYYPEVWA